MLYAEYLLALERVRSLSTKLLADELRGHAADFLARRWVIRDGHLTSLLVPVLDSEEEVEVDIDYERDTFSYRCPGAMARVITRPLTEIALYAVNLDAWMDEICDLFEIEPSRRARRREVIAEHLWHLGDVRIGNTHRFAPIYLARRLESSGPEWRKALLDAKRPSPGIVLTAREIEIELPNRHQACAIDLILVNSGNEITCDTDLLNRLLKGTAANANDPDEYFDTDSGELKLACATHPKIFKGKQKEVISMFWKVRDQHGIKWSDVTTRTSCGKDPDSVFGSEWTAWLERISGQRGYYRLRTRQ